MDKKEALKKYLNKHLLKLTSSSCTKIVEKTLRTKFAEENHLKSESRFSANEVAEEVAEYILKSRSLGRKEFTSDLLKIPFINDTLSVEKLEIIYDTKQPESSLFFEVKDLPKLNQEEFLRRIEEEYNRRAQQKAEEEIKQDREELRRITVEVEKKREELQKFESELRKVPPDISVNELEDQVEKINSQDDDDYLTTWWKRMGLPQNPFETNTGLSGISQDRYEEVVVKTPLVTKYKESLQSNPETFSGKTIMLTGDFGSGKTTIFQYLSYFSASFGVLPITIILNPTQSVTNLTSIFLDEVINSLSKVFIDIRKYDPRSERPSGNQMRYCLELLQELKNDAPHGFIIFVDGLHKSDIYLKQVLEFLKHVQNILEYFINGWVKIGFMIAGSPLWERELERQPSLSGSYYSKDTVPVLTEEYAIEAIDRRINLYPSKSMETITIDKGAMRKAFEVLSQRLKRGLTFRDFLDHVRQRLEVNEFEEVGLSVKIHIETVDAVKAVMTRSNLSKKYEEILSEISTSIQLRKALQRVAPHILKGVSETEQLFRTNKGAFYLLMKHDFIVQRKMGDESEFKWFFSDEVINTLLMVSRRLQISPSRVFVAMFEEESFAKEQESNAMYSSSRSKIMEMITTWSDSHPDVALLLVECKNGLDSINQHMKSMRNITLDMLKNPMMSIIRSIVKVTYPSFSSGSVLDCFKESWNAPENIDKILEFLEGGITVPTNAQDLYGLLHNHNKYIFQLSDILQEQMRGESITRLVNRKLTHAQLLSLDSLRKEFFKQAYDGVVNGICTLLEKDIRDVVYSCMRSLWGEKSIEFLPAEIRKRITDLTNRGHKRTRRASDINFLYDVSRGDYSTIFSDKKIYEGLLSDILRGDDKRKFMDSISLAFSLDSRKAHRDRESYFREHSTEVLDALKAMPWLLEVFHKMMSNFLLDCDVSLKTESEKLIVRFKPALKNNLSTTEFTISRDELLFISKGILGPLTLNDIPLDLTGVTFTEIDVEPEILFSVFRANRMKGFISYSEKTNTPGFISITKEGREWLERAEQVS